jgi:hypothetical protein
MAGDPATFRLVVFRHLPRREQLFPNRQCGRMSIGRGEPHPQLVSRRIEDPTQRIDRG